MSEKQTDGLPTFNDFESGSLLSELEETEEITGGEDNQEEEKEKKEKEEAEAQAEKEKAEAKEKAAKEKAEKAEKAKAEKAEKEKEEKEAKTKGKAKEEEEEEEEGKAKGKEKEEEEDTPPEGTFWTDVEKITGNPVEIDWEKEGVDPETPEGAALREAAIRQQTVDQYLEYLEQSYPKGFRALQHEAKGGSIEELYKPGEPDFSKVTIEEKNEAQHEAILMSYYMEFKGLSESKARKMVTAEKDEENTFKAAKEAVEERAKYQEEKREEVEKEQLRIEKEMKKRDTAMTEALSEVIDSGNLGTFTVPQNERGEFYDYVANRIQRDGRGGYVVVSPITQKEFLSNLQQLYLGYKKGDLSKIIERKATTESTKRLKRRIEEEKSKEKDTKEKEETRKNRSLPDMADFEA